jgi:hypothetical protein
MGLPDSDPLVRDTSPWIRTRIRKKMSRIWNTVFNIFKTFIFSFCLSFSHFLLNVLELHQYPHYDRKLKQKRQNISMLRLYFIFGYQYSNYIFCSPLGLKFSGMFKLQPRRLSMQKMMCKFSLSLLVCLSCHLLVRRIIFQRSPPHALDVKTIN